MPVRSGMGMTLLQKMGWKPGEGLGKNKEGCQEPLQLEVKMDRKGKPNVTVKGMTTFSFTINICDTFSLCLQDWWPLKRYEPGAPHRLSINQGLPRLLTLSL